MKIIYVSLILGAMVLYVMFTLINGVDRKLNKMADKNAAMMEKYYKNSRE